MNILQEIKIKMITITMYNICTITLYSNSLSIKMIINNYYNIMNKYKI